jgi:excisionase family DNA binding protein
MESLFSSSYVAGKTDMHPSTIRRMVADGRLRGVRIGSRLRIPESAVRELLAGGVR